MYFLLSNQNMKGKGKKHQTKKPKHSNTLLFKVPPMRYYHISNKRWTRNKRF